MKMMAENVFSELTNSSNGELFYGLQHLKNQYYYHKHIVGKGISEDTAKQWLSEELALATNDVSSISMIHKAMSCTTL